MELELEKTVERLTPRLLAFAYGRTGDRDLAEEVAQEALTALVGRWRRAGAPDSPEAFTIAIARRRASRLLARRRLTAPFDHHRPEPAEDPEQTLERTVVLAAIARLPRYDREALLAVAAGFEPAEAARALGIGGSTFRMRLLRARQRLAAILSGENR
jgi:RNA polymerase sigma-70 factor (ECF subfamily)